MTPAEAIENEIAREREEFEGLEGEADRLEEQITAAMEAGEPWGDLVRRMIQVLERLEKREEFEEEIRGKEEALQAVRDDPDSPMEGIGRIITGEMVSARNLGRRAQRLREEAWRDEKAGDDEEAARKREEANRLFEQHNRELARLRGKHHAGRAVARTLKD